MNYTEARAYLNRAGKYGSVLGLKGMKELLKRLGNPQDTLKFIHIAGTNGKGSVLAYVSTILQKAGYHIGRYISPTLFTYRERIQVNGEPIEKAALALLTEQTAAAAAAMTAAGLPHPTVFEIETAIGFLYFRDKQCDLVVLETGLGGAEDATNVVTTTVMEIFTPISKDHMNFLGDTVSEIALNKAGIIKPGTLVVSAIQERQVMTILEQAAERNMAALRTLQPDQIRDITYGWQQQRFSYGGLEQLEILLAGTCQIDNAALAVEAIKGLRTLGYQISDEQIRAGLAQTRWQGRFSTLMEEPIFIIDGAHNKAAAEFLKNSVEMYFTNRRIFYIIGVFKDKEYEEIIRLTAPAAEHILTIQTPNNERALDAETLADVVRKYNPSVEAAASIADAVGKSLQLAGKDDVIIAFGSLSFLGELTAVVNQARSAEK